MVELTPVQAFDGGKWTMRRTDSVVSRDSLMEDPQETEAKIEQALSAKTRELDFSHSSTSSLRSFIQQANQQQQQ